MDVQTRETRRSVSVHAKSLLGGDLRLIALGAIMLTLLIALSESGVLEGVPRAVWVAVLIPRFLLGFLYLLFVPGYALTAALFPTAPNTSKALGEGLGGIERLGLSLGLSIAWASVLALVLDRLPWGLRTWPILMGETMSVLIFMAVAVWRRTRLPSDEVYIPPLDWRPRSWWQTLSAYEKRIYALSGAALLIAGLAAAWILTVPSPNEFMTEFYILGRNGLAEHYPHEATVDAALTVTMGIHNLEPSVHTYRVEVWVVDVWEDRDALITREGPFTLAPEEKVETEVDWSMPWVGRDQRVEFRLFGREDELDETRQAPWGPPYRRVHLWLDVEAPES